MALSLSVELSACRACHPFSLKHPPKPSHVWAAVSATVTVAVPVEVAMVPGVQVVLVPETQLPLFDVNTAGPAEVAPAADEPPLDTPPPDVVPAAPVVPPGPPAAPLVVPVRPPGLAVEPPGLPVEPPGLAVEPPGLPVEPPLGVLLEPPLGVLLEPPLGVLLEPPLGVLLEPPLELPPETLELPPLWPPELPCVDVVLFPELQAATRNARETLVIDVRGLFIAQPRFKLVHGRGPTAVRMVDLFYSVFLLGHSPIFQHNIARTIPASGIPVP
jgi:hypothetical protein